jgi:hypothetical protein
MNISSFTTHMDEHHASLMECLLFRHVVLARADMKFQDYIRVKMELSRTIERRGYARRHYGQRADVSASKTHLEQEEFAGPVLYDLVLK